MDRKSQIFKETKRVGNIRRPVTKPSAPQVNLKTVLDGFKGSLTPTILKTCSFKCGDEIHTIEHPNIQSITKGKKNMCFVVTGNETIAKQDDILKKIPKDVESDLKKIGMNRGGQNDANGHSSNESINRESKAIRDDLNSNRDELQELD